MRGSKARPTEEGVALGRRCVQNLVGGTLSTILTPPGRSGLMAGRTLDAGRIVRALRHSYAGLRDVFLSEAAFRQELILAAALVPAAVWLGEDGAERALMIGSLLLVLIVELLNSAVETVVDRVGTELHDLSGRAKDIGSAAVFISLVNVPVVWALVLLD